MKTPTERFQNDSYFATLVNTLESFIWQAKYTPSELRDAAVLAAIHYEMKQPRPPYFLSQNLTVEEFLKGDIDDSR